MKIDYLDLYLIQYPTHFFTINEPLYKIWARMEKLVELGLTRSIGVANFNVQLLLDMFTYCNIRPACN